MIGPQVLKILKEHALNFIHVCPLHWMGGIVYFMLEYRYQIAKCKSGIRLPFILPHTVTDIAETHQILYTCALHFWLSILYSSILYSDIYTKVNKNVKKNWCWWVFNSGPSSVFQDMLAFQLCSMSICFISYPRKECTQSTCISFNNFGWFCFRFFWNKPY